MAYRTLLIGQGLRRLSARSGSLHSSAREGSLNGLRETIVTGNDSSRFGKVTFCAVCALQPFGCFCCDTCPGSWHLLGQAALRLDLGHESSGLDISSCHQGQARSTEVGLCLWNHLEPELVLKQTLGSFYSAPWRVGGSIFSWRGFVWFFVFWGFFAPPSFF